MKLKLTLLSISILLSLSTLYAQQSGNMVYGQNYGIESKQRPERLQLTDSTFMIEANVVMNVIADSYVATFGLSDEAPTVKECNDKLEKRIQAFTSELNKMGYSGTDIYVDMITQNKVYDYKTTGSIAEQYLKGFELKKNVIIKLKTIKDLDNILISASSQQIYDLVKVDYIVTDIPAVYAQLFKAASEIINQKKGLYVSATNARLATTSQIYGEQFYSYYPNQLYKAYTAYESSDVYSTYSNYTRKELKKGATFYYDKINYSNFDKVINPAVTEPAVEFVLVLQLKFSAERQKK